MGDQRQDSQDGDADNDGSDDDPDPSPSPREPEDGRQHEKERHRSDVVAGDISRVHRGRFAIIQSISEISIREATEADLEQVAEIKVRNWADTYAWLVEPEVLGPFLDRTRQLAELRKSVSRLETILLVAQNKSGTVIGFALTYLDGEPDPWLESLHVLSESRGSGVGTLLMRETAARVRSRGYNTMRLGVVEGNVAASRFYDRLGAEMMGREPASWAEGVWHELYRWPDLAPLLQ